MTPSNRFFPKAGPVVERTQRFPKYSDEEMVPFFAEIEKGYCYKQAADRCKYERKWVLNTIYSDDETADHMLMLAMRAGARIRAGLQPAPLDRYDGLYSTGE